MDYKIEMISVPKVLLNRLKQYIEHVESTLEYEYGDARRLEELVYIGDMPIEYYEIVKLLEENERV